MSEPAHPKEVALRELGHADAVVLIVGFKAGSLLDAGSGLTYTRAEFDLACELEKPIFAFVETQNGRWRNDEDSPALRGALESFRDAVRQETTVKEFEGAAALGEEVALAIAQWEQMGRPGARLTFASWHEYFPPRVGLFDYEQTLRGRAKEIRELNEFLSNDKWGVAIMVGRGGVGKSKLLRDWSTELPGWQQLFLRQAAIWHAEASKEVPAGRILIIADDAHRFSELTKLLALGCELFETRACKLLLCARPSGQADIDEVVARSFDAPNVLRLPPLESLELQDSEKLAEEVLGPNYRHLARQLAVISGDAPLVTVVGGRLIAQNRVSPLLMTTEDDFRRAVFDKYIVEYERLLPGDPQMWRQLLSLIAALSPLAVNDSRFLGRATEFLRLRQDEILNGTETLVRHGLLIRQGGAARIAPDVLSDYLLEQACVQSDGEPTRFADEVFAYFEPTHLAGLLRNLAELDWRITQKKAASSELLGRVWAQFFADYRDADAGGRCRMLDSFKDAAFFQPVRAMELANYSVKHPVPRSGEIGWLEHGQTDILHKLPGLLQNVAYNGAHLDGAIKLLWDLAKQDTRDTNPHPGHALRVLQELAAYGRYKGVGFNLRIADFLSELLTDPSAFESRYTPLDVIDELLEKEGEHQESDGLTIALSAFALAYDRVREIRRKALSMVETCFGMDNPRASSRAVQSLSKVLSGFALKFGRRPTEEELVWQDTERMEALAVIERRLDREPVPVPLARELRRILKHFSRGKRNDSIDRAIERLLDRIGYPDDLFIYDTFCTSTWDYDVVSTDLEDGGRCLAARVQHASSLLRERFHRPEDQIAELERMLSEAASYGVDAVSSCYLVVQSLCQESDFRSEFSSYVFAGASPALAIQIRVLLPILRRTDPEEYLRLGSMAAKGGPPIARGAANAVCYGGTLRSPIAQDLQILRFLSQHPDRNVRSDALTGVGTIGRSEVYREAAIELALAIDIGTDGNLAEDLSRVFHPSGLHPDGLTPAQVRAILWKLVPLGDLDVHDQSYHLSEFLNWACRNHPELTFEFVIARLDEAAALRLNSTEWQSYDAVPDPGIQAKFHALSHTARYAEFLERVRDRMVIEGHDAHELTRVFWSIGALDVDTLSVIDVWLRCGDQAKFEAVLRLIRSGPEDLAFLFPYFAVHVLRCASEFGDDMIQEAIDSLVAKTLDRSWMGEAAAPPPAMTQLLGRATHLVEALAGVAEGVRLFSAVAESVRKQIQWWKEGSDVIHRRGNWRSC